jgi:hypothetical protein
MLSEADEVHKGKRGRVWLCCWDRLNTWLSRHAVKNGEPCVSPLYQGLLYAAAWLFCSPVFVSVILVAMGGKSQDDAVFALNLWSSVKVIFLGVLPIALFTDLRYEATGQRFR